MYTKDEINDWIIREGGIINTGDNHFGGDPNFIGKSRLNLQIQQRPSELSSLIYFLLEKKSIGENLKYYAEIGACSGGTTYAINNFMKFDELLIIDDGGAENEDYIKKRGDHARASNLGTIHRVEIIGSSMDKKVINLAKALSSLKKYDILFIDGEHTVNAVRSDLLNYETIVRDGGYIIFHDTTHMRMLKDCVLQIIEETKKFKFLIDFSEKDTFTEMYPDGIGITIIQKN